MIQEQAVGYNGELDRERAMWAKVIRKRFERG